LYECSNQRPTIPFTLFTEPELPRIGLTEGEARRQGLEIRVAELPVAAIPAPKRRAKRAASLKPLWDVKTNRILLCTILSVEAGEMLGTVQMASAGWRSPHCAMRPRNRGV